MKLFRLSAVLLTTGFAWVPVVNGQDNRPSSASTPGASQAEKASLAAPLVRSTTNLVVVDVIVSHNGRFVKGLPKEAFRVVEDSQEQEVKSFEEHGPDNAGSGAKSELPPNTYSNVPESPANAINVLLLDSINTPISDQAYARRKILEYLQTVPAGTRIGVFTLASRLRLVQGFTTDSTVLLAAVTKVMPTQSLALPGPQGESAADRFSALPNMQNNLAGLSGMDQVIQSLHEFEADEQANLIDRRVQITLDALKQLALYLGALPGRKNVIWFSASFPLSLSPGMAFDPFKSLHAYGPQLQQVSDLLTASRVAVYPIDARGLITAPMPVRQNRPAAVPVGAGRTGMIDPNAFPSDPSQSGDRNNAELATMLQLAEETGGIASYNNNGLKQALARAIDNGSSYYTLTYSPEDRKFDGKFRKIHVKLSGHNYTLTYRRGYFADGPSAHSTNALLALSSPALQPDAPAYSQILFRARILADGEPGTEGLQSVGPAGDLAGKLKPPIRRCWIEYNVDLHQVSAEINAEGFYRSNIEFMVIAYNQNGKLVNASRRALKLGIPPSKYDEVLQSGYPVHDAIDLPEGQVWLRLAVHDIATDRIGSLEVPLRISAKAAN
ncbi:MAG TPA: VWA domain-containing protein [Candidatus Angelobacter sp.]|nr:VWA domain-containing protein [Candidatus Angelobacter sp.]